MHSQKKFTEKEMIAAGAEHHKVLISSIFRPELVNWINRLSPSKIGNIMEEVVHKVFNGTPLFESASADGSYNTGPYIYTKLGKVSGGIYEIKCTSRRYNIRNGEILEANRTWTKNNVSILHATNGDFIMGVYNRHDSILDVYILNYSDAVRSFPGRRWSNIVNPKYFSEDDHGNGVSLPRTSKRPRLA
jgi:hypothetical protein